MCLNLNARRVYRGGGEVFLTAREMAFLELFLRNPGKPFARRELEDLLWGTIAKADRTSAKAGRTSSKCMLGGFGVSYRRMANPL